MRKIDIFDTTLRDGQQSPGSAFSLEKKLEVARRLYRLNVDTIEAGFPIASKTDFDLIRVLSEELKGISICAFARATKKDIEVAAKALNGYEKGRIQIVTPVSDLHLHTRLGKSREQGLELIKDGLNMARGLVPEVSWIGEDSSRADQYYLIDAFNTAAECGAKIVTYADTVGYSLPEEMGEVIKIIVKSLESKSKVGIHCHNDLGLAVANTVSAISAGAEEVQCTINGVGERAGNTSLEEIVMAIQVRKDKLDVFSDVDSRLLTNTCDLVSKFTNSPIAKNKPIVGENAFAHCSGMHQHGVLACAENYEIMRPMDIGAKGKGIVIGKYSGRHGVKHILEESGISVTDVALGNLMKDIKLLKDNQHIGADDMISMLEKYE
jgi:2-isopropylmalate synthase